MQYSAHTLVKARSTLSSNSWSVEGGGPMNVNHTAGGYDEKGIDVADVLLELSFVPRIRI